MKVGDYVRTKKASRLDVMIAKIVKIMQDEEEELGIMLYHLDNYSSERSVCSDYEIKKSSLNIIDLIEVGDYVDGEKVNSIEIDSYKNYNINNKGWKNINIKSIVTKEQFEAIKYEIK